jgi:hypothetical protein
MLSSLPFLRRFIARCTGQINPPLFSFREMLIFNDYFFIAVLVGTTTFLLVVFTGAVSA